MALWELRSGNGIVCGPVTEDSAGQTPHYSVDLLGGTCLLPLPSPKIQT